MANTDFIVPRLRDAGCWMDMRYLEGGYGWRGDRPLKDIVKLVVHHTVSNQYQDAKKEFTEIWQHRRYGGTPYHFLISSEIKNGLAVVGYMGDVGSIRAHAVNEKGKDGLPARKGNNYSIGISFIGDHRKKMPSKEMLTSAKLLIEEFIALDPRFSGLGMWEDVIGHGYWDYTWCPDGNEGNTSINLIKNTETMEDQKLKDARTWLENMFNKYGVDMRYISDDLAKAFYDYTNYLPLTAHDDKLVK